MARWTRQIPQYISRAGIYSSLAVIGPFCLLNIAYKVLSAIVNDRLYQLCERHGLLDPPQEGFRRLRSTQRQVQSLHRVIDEAAR